MNKIKFLLSLIAFSAMNFLIIFLGSKQFVVHKSRFIVLLVLGLFSVAAALIPTSLLVGIKKGFSRSLVARNIISIIIYFIVYYTVVRGLVIIPCC